MARQLPEMATAMLPMRPELFANPYGVSPMEPELWPIALEMAAMQGIALSAKDNSASKRARDDSAGRTSECERARDDRGPVRTAGDARRYGRRDGIYAAFAVVAVAVTGVAVAVTGAADSVVAE